MEGGGDLTKEALMLQGPPMAADSAVARRRTQTNVAGEMMMQHHPVVPSRLSKT